MILIGTLLAASLTAGMTGGSLPQSSVSSSSATFGSNYVVANTGALQSGAVMMAQHVIALPAVVANASGVAGNGTSPPFRSVTAMLAATTPSISVNTGAGATAAGNRVRSRFAFASDGTRYIIEANYVYNKYG